MTTPYVCERNTRLQALRRNPVGSNAIDYLEVVDISPDPPDRFRRLEIHFVNNLHLDLLKPENFRITGGERVTGIKVLNVSIDGGNDEVLLIDVDRAGDHSEYCLSVVDPAQPQKPPENFDPILSEARFIFTVDCRSEFDCAPTDTCLPDSRPDPELDYLAKDYQSFRQLMLDRLSATLPSWHDRNAADPWIATIETLAYSADTLSYYQDAVATEAYLGTSRKRVSARRHGRLLDYQLHEGVNARCWVVLNPAADINDSIPVGTPVMSRVSHDIDNIAPERLAEFQAKNPIVFETLESISSLRTARNEIPFYVWQDSECCLPKGATEASLLDADRTDNDTTTGLALVAGDVLIFEEIAMPNAETVVDPAHRHAVRIVADPVASSDPLTGDKVLDIRWHDEDAMPFPLCLRRVDGNKDKSALVSVARGNVVLADHGLTRSNHPMLGSMNFHGGGLVPGTVPAEGRYRPVVIEDPMTINEPEWLREGKDRTATPASKSLEQDVGTALPTLRLYDGQEVWLPVRDLLNSGRFSSEFVFERDDSGRATLRFGDNRFGRRPVPQSSFFTRYRLGSGTAGNVGADALAHLVSNVTGGVTVVARNPMPAIGGLEPQVKEDVRRFAPAAFRRQIRAVTVDDYARIAEEHSDVQRAIATRRWTGSWYTIFITVDRKGGREIDVDFEDSIRRHLEIYRLAGQDVEINGPKLVPILIAMNVCTERGFFDMDVKAALQKTFSNRAFPDGSNGFFHPDEFTFGQPLLLSPLIARAMSITGVRWVNLSADDPAHRFQRQRGPARGAILQGRIDMDRLEIVQVDSDKNAPEHGRIEFLMGANDANSIR